MFLYIKYKNKHIKYVAIQYARMPKRELSLLLLFSIILQKEGLLLTLESDIKELIFTHGIERN